MARRLHRLGRWCVEHRGRVVLIWLALLLLVGGLAKTVGGTYRDEMTVPDAESQRALDILRDRFPDAAGGSAMIVVHVDAVQATEPGDGTLQDGERRQALDEVAAAAGELPGVRRVQGAQLSPDGRTAIIPVQYEDELTDLDQGDLEALVDTSAPLADLGIRTEIGGELPLYVDQAETGPAEILGIVAAVFILLFAFGSVLAMGLPIGVALFGLGMTMAFMTLGAAVVDVARTAPVLASMIGLGVGIDYALFVVTRHREHLSDGMTVAESAGRANATAGQAVIFAGGTVVIAICGLAISGIPLVTVMGFGTAIVVGTMVLATITLLPALLGFAGHRIDRLSFLRVKHDRADHVSIWARWGRTVARRPWPYLVAGVVLLLALTAPLFSIRFGMADAGAMPESTTQRRAYDLVADAFGPGVNGPLLLAIESGDEAAANRVTEAVADVPGVAIALPPQMSPAGDASIVIVIPESAPQDADTTHLIHRLRDDVLPEVGVPVHVGGFTALFSDLSEKVANRLPWFVGTVVGLSFLLLMVVFRSVLVPLKAALLNLLSIGAAYGVIVAVFQWGWLKGLVGLDDVVPIIAFVPMMMFAILFGLSMDYEVFLLSRIREEYLATGDNTESVVAGIASTARVITSAALIMICVFLGFVLAEDPVVKMTGLGLAVAVLVDATIVRVILVPATMRLLGDANWWLPKWLDRILPHVDIEGGYGLPEPEWEDEDEPSSSGPDEDGHPGPGLGDGAEAPSVVRVPVLGQA